MKIVYLRKVISIPSQPFKIECVDDVEVIRLPRRYDVTVWGRVLEYQRMHQLPGIKHIIVDFASVESIGDSGNEMYILRDEFQRSGGISVIFAGVPDPVETVFRLLEEGITLPIPRFSNSEAALDFLKRQYH